MQMDFKLIFYTFLGFSVLFQNVHAIREIISPAESISLTDVVKVARRGLDIPVFGILLQLHK